MTPERVSAVKLINTSRQYDGLPSSYSVSFWYDCVTSRCVSTTRMGHGVLFPVGGMTSWICHAQHPIDGKSWISWKNVRGAFDWNNIWFVDVATLVLAHADFIIDALRTHKLLMHSYKQPTNHNLRHWSMKLISSELNYYWVRLHPWNCKLENCCVASMCVLCIRDLAPLLRSF